MIVFRVGQRVRIVKTELENHRLIGRETTITAIDGDRIEVDIPAPLFGNMWGYAYQLEPIQPERNRIVAWETLPFDPRKVLEGVS